MRILSILGVSKIVYSKPAKPDNFHIFPTTNLQQHLTFTNQPIILWIEQASYASLVDEVGFLTTVLKSRLSYDSKCPNVSRTTTHSNTSF